MLQSYHTPGPYKLFEAALDKKIVQLDTGPGI